MNIVELSNNSIIHKKVVDPKVLKKSINSIRKYS